MNLSKIEFDWAITQLESLGYIDSTRDRTGIALTDKGSQQASDILDSHPVYDRLLLILFCADLGSKGYEEDKL